jgi:hypothetical protein
MKQEITVKEKSVYGKTLIYPACDKSNIFAGLIRMKTFDHSHLRLIEGLGYTVNLIKLP